MDNNKKILQTLIYSDIFAYPLTQEELWYYFHTNVSVSKKTFAVLLEKHNGFATDGTYFFLPKRNYIVAQRKKLQQTNEDKLLFAKKIVGVLRHIPTIELIGISGSVSMMSAKEDDDIDLFFITQPGTLWLTRFLVLLYLHMLGVGRKRSDTKAKNKICANMFLDRAALQFSSQRQNIYTARELAQLKVLFEKKLCYQSLLQANKWVNTFLYNVPVTSKQIDYYIHPQFFFSCLEYVARNLQLWYMRNHKTREEITNHLLAFHPMPYDEYIVRKYEEKKKIYGV